MFCCVETISNFYDLETCIFPAPRATHFVQDFLPHFLADFEMLRFGRLEVTSRCPMHSKEAKEMKSGKKLSFYDL